jgi:hypothetical protein
MVIVELFDEFGGVYIGLVCPAVLFVAIALPLYQELQFVSVHTAVNDTFDFVMFFACNEDRWRGRASFSARDGVG